MELATVKAQNYYYGNPAQFINLEKDASKTPRWIVLSETLGKVYSEFELLDEEKRGCNANQHDL